MTIDLHHMEVSGPCRAVRMVAREIGVDLNLIPVNLRENEHLTPEFLKLNPQHTVPTLVDGDLSIGESRAQMCYLVNKYSPGHKIYPECPQKRASIDRFLYFDIGTLYSSFANYFYPQFKQDKEPCPASEQKMKDALKVLEELLGDQTYITGDDYTIADISLAGVLTMFELTGYGFAGCDKVEALFNRIKQLPYWDEVNALGSEQLKGFFEAAKAAKAAKAESA